MSIQVNTGANAVNWEALLGKLGEVEKSTGVDGKEVFTITTNVDGETRTATISLPELDLPEVMDESTFEELVSKLEATGLGFTPEQVAEMKDSITQAYNAAAGALNDVKASSKGSVLFDLYALMALMIEVAQSQRDAARDMRTAQSQAIQKSIQDQADMQREAARVGMIVGIVCGAASALVSLGMMAAQGVTANTQSKIMAQSGADASKMHSTMLQNTDTVAHADAQLQSTTAKVGNEVANRVGADFDAQLVDDQYGNLQQNFTSAKDNVDAKQANLDAKNAELQTAQNTLAEKTQAKDTAQAQIDTLNDKINAYWEKHQYIQREGGNADPARIAEFDQRIGENFNLNQAHADLDVAQAALNTANTDLPTAQNDVRIKQGNVDIARNELNAAKTDLAKARSDYVKTVQDVAAQYQEKYQTAVDRLANPPEGADKAQLQANVETARTDMEMAFAKEAQLLSQDGVMTQSEQKDMVAAARTKVDITTDRVYQRADFKAAERRMGMFAGFNSINQSIGGMMQSVAQSLTAIKSADASRLGAETKEQEEMLDQTKDLYQQEQKLIDAVIQLLTAVGQAETQSMRDAIQA